MNGVSEPRFENRWIGQRPQSMKFYLIPECKILFNTSISKAQHRVSQNLKCNYIEGQKEYKVNVPDLHSVDPSSTSWTKYGVPSSPEMLFEDRASEPWVPEGTVSPTPSMKVKCFHRGLDLNTVSGFSFLHIKAFNMQWIRIL